MIRRFFFSWRDLNIRNKLLSFYAAMILCIMLINLTTSLTAFRIMRAFDQRLQVYFHIQEFRMSFSESRSNLEAFLKERVEDQRRRYLSGIPALWQGYKRMNELADTSLESHLQLRAIDRGLTEYFLRAARTIRLRDDQAEDYYRTYLDTLRVYTYVEGYTEILLNANLNDGSQAYGLMVSRAGRVRLYSFLSLGVVGVAFIIFGILFANSVSRPIHRLAELSSRIADGELAVEIVPVNRSDEIGVLAESFNSMSSSIRQMVEGLKEKAELERRLHEDEIALERARRSLQEARLMSLQSQINPHFLFNTLNTISRTALFERAEGTAGLIKSLAALFRYHLRDHRKSVCFSEELMILEEYLSLQQYRFGDRLRYRIECGIEANKYQVPAFILQPLVENAVKYGIEPKEAGGSILVEAHREADRIIVRISDTGVGMSSAAARRIISAARNGGGGIGLANVLERLNLFYNGREEFSFDSEEGIGTKVTLSFPATENEEVKCTPC